MVKKIFSICVGSLFIMFAPACDKIKNTTSKLRAGEAVAESAGYNTDRNTDTVAGTLEIVEKWVMPPELFEISGITWLEGNKIACVQDELGVIYIYDLQSRRVEKTISFAPPGDFEDLTKAGEYFYVIRSDGTIFKVDPANPANSASFSTGLNKKQNCEGMCYDSKSNKLLIAIKGPDPVSDAYKSIFAFDLSTQKMDASPLAVIDITDPLLEADGRPVSKRYEPSAIAVQNGKLYICCATVPTVMILSPYKSIQSLIRLDRSVLPKAEGITFSGKGEMYISTEGGKGLGNGVINRCRIR